MFQNVNVSGYDDIFLPLRCRKEKRGFSLLLKATQREQRFCVFTAFLCAFSTSC